MTKDLELAITHLAAATAEASKAAAVASQAVVQATTLAAEAKIEAAAARTEHLAHDKICTERQATLIKNQDEAKAERKEMHLANQDSIRRLYGLLWKVALGAIAGLLGILVTILLKQ